MVDKKYPIGTRIRFIANESMCHEAKQDDGKIGVVVVGTTSYQIRIFLPDSVKSSTGGYWSTGRENIKPLAIKGQQLLFSFMDE